MNNLETKSLPPKAVLLEMLARDLGANIETQQYYIGESRSS